MFPFHTELFNPSFIHKALWAIFVINKNIQQFILFRYHHRTLHHHDRVSRDIAGHDAPRSNPAIAFLFFPIYRNHPKRGGVLYKTLFQSSHGSYKNIHIPIHYSMEKSSLTKSDFFRITTSSYINISTSSSYCPICELFSIPFILFQIRGKKSTPAPYACR